MRITKETTIESINNLRKSYAPRWEEEAKLVREARKNLDGIKLSEAEQRYSDFETVGTSVIEVIRLRKLLSSSNQVEQKEAVKVKVTKFTKASDKEAPKVEVEKVDPLRGSAIGRVSALLSFLDGIQDKAETEKRHMLDHAADYLDVWLVAVEGQLDSPLTNPVYHVIKNMHDRLKSGEDIEVLLEDMRAYI